MQLEGFANIDFNNPFQNLETTEGEEDNLELSSDEKDTDTSGEVMPLESDEELSTDTTEEVDTDAAVEEDNTDTDKWELTDEQAPEILNALAQLGMITEIPEEIDQENIDANAAKEILKFRDNKLVEEARLEGAKAAQTRIVGKLSTTLQKAVIQNLQNPNMEDSELISYLQGIQNAGKITNLTPDKNAEEIVREAYKAEGYKPTQINEKVADLIQLDKLTREAEILKPKLDARAQSIVQAQEEHARKIADFEVQRQTELHQRTTKLLNSGAISGIPLSRELSSFLYTTLMNNEVPVDIKGKRVEMGALEALVMNNKYSKEPEALERVALAAIVLKDGVEELNKHLSKRVITKETEKAVKQFKFSNKRKTSSTSSRPVSKEEDAPFTIRF